MSLMDAKETECAEGKKKYRAEASRAVFEVPTDNLPINKGIEDPGLQEGPTPTSRAEFFVS